MKGCIVLADGFEELEAIGTMALLIRSGIEMDLYSLGGETMLHGKHGLAIAELQNSATLDPTAYDCLLIAGGAQWKELDGSQSFASIITSFYRAGKLIAAICAAPTILGRMGLLKGKRYTCFTSMNDDFGGTYINTYVVQDGNFITARSAAASIDFAFAIIAYLQGDEQKKRIQKQIYYDR